MHYQLPYALLNGFMGVDPVTERATLITTLILRNYIGMVSAFTNTSRKIPATINRIVSIVMTFLRMLDMIRKQDKMSKPKLGGEEKLVKIYQPIPRMIEILHEHQTLKTPTEHHT